MIGDFIKPIGDFKHDLIEGVCDVHGEYTTWHAWIGESDFPGPCPQCCAERVDPLAKRERERKEADEEARLAAMGIGASLGERRWRPTRRRR